MKSIKFLGWAWPIEVAVLVLAGMIIIFAFPDRAEYYIRMTPAVAMLIGAQGGAAFGGPILKQRIEVKNAEKTK